jgi:hypothetical protein
MPLTRVSLLRGKPPEYRQAILDGLYQAMREVFDVPEDDRFMTIDEYDKGKELVVWQRHRAICVSGHSARLGISLVLAEVAANR